MEILKENTVYYLYFRRGYSSMVIKTALYKCFKVSF